MNNKYCLLSNDVESTSIWFNSLRDKTAYKVYNEGLPRLLDLYDKYSINTTFFITGYIANLIPDIVTKISSRGHEIGSHGLSHKKEHGFDVIDYKTQLEHLKKSKKILEDISGKEVISFRSPALRLSDNTVKALQESGYKIDSSVAPQRLDMFMSNGSRNKFKWLKSPRLPYRVSSDSIFDKGNSDLIEVPLSALGLPYIGTTMRVLPFLTRIQKYLLHFENLFNKKPIVFIIHPNELINEENGRRNLRINHEDKLSSFLKDHLRGRLKVKNLGKRALRMYESHLKFFRNKGYHFLPLRDYVRKQGYKI